MSKRKREVSWFCWQVAKMSKSCHSHRDALLFAFTRPPSKTSVGSITSSLIKKDRTCSHNDVRLNGISAALFLFLTCSILLCGQASLMLLFSSLIELENCENEVDVPHREDLNLTCQETKDKERALMPSDWWMMLLHYVSWTSWFLHWTKHRFSLQMPLFFCMAVQQSIVLWGARWEECIFQLKHSLVGCCSKDPLALPGCKFLYSFHIARIVMFRSHSVLFHFVSLTNHRLVVHLTDALHFCIIKLLLCSRFHFHVASSS